MRPTLIYTDGACSGNPGPGGWAAIIVTPDLQIIELGGPELGTTNNRMEIRAPLEALRAVRDVSGPVQIFTDSTYVIRGITQWLWGWRKRGWKTAEGLPVVNQDLWEALSTLTYGRKDQEKVQWSYVRGHTGVPGNERCDEIAVQFSSGNSPKLYRGPVGGYGLDLLTPPKTEPLPEMSKGSGEKKKPVSYLSLLGGTPIRHSSWPACERRVKGQPGAKFKKAMTSLEEIEILRAWGVDPSRLQDE